MSYLLLVRRRGFSLPARVVRSAIFPSEVRTKWKNRSSIHGEVEVEVEGEDVDVRRVVRDSRIAAKGRVQPDDSGALMGAG